MKEIPKIMKFDFITASSYGIPAIIAFFLLSVPFGMILSPLTFLFIFLGSSFFIFSLAPTAEKNNFNKLYGVLPIQRKNITRARFLYIFLLFFTAEIAVLLLTKISFSLNLWSYINFENSIKQKIIVAFESTDLTVNLTEYIFLGFCLIFSYLEMAEQIGGLENLAKILLITITIIVGIIAIVSIINAKNDNLFPFNLPELTSLPKIIAVNIIALIICLLFGEITKCSLVKREL